MQSYSRECSILHDWIKVPRPSPFPFSISASESFCFFNANFFLFAIKPKYFAINGRLSSSRKHTSAFQSALCECGLNIEALYSKSILKWNFSIFSRHEALHSIERAGKAVINKFVFTFSSGEEKMKDMKDLSFWLIKSLTIFSFALLGCRAVHEGSKKKESSLVSFPKLKNCTIITRPSRSCWCFFWGNHVFKVCKSIRLQLELPRGSRAKHTKLVSKVSLKDITKVEVEILGIFFVFFFLCWLFVD